MVSEQEKLYLALEEILERLSKSSSPQQKLADQLTTMLQNHYEELGRENRDISGEVDVQIRTDSDDVSGLTEKQEKAYRLCKELTAEKKREKRFLVKKLQTQGIYSSQNEAESALKYLLINEKTRLESRGRKVENVAEE